jgi:superfamily II DNA/RNA helicase
VSESQLTQVDLVETLNPRTSTTQRPRALHCPSRYNLQTLTLHPISQDLLISTPARLVALVSGKGVDLSTVTMVVIDEADKLFDHGFVEQVEPQTLSSRS